MPDQSLDEDFIGPDASSSYQPTVPFLLPPPFSIPPEPSVSGARRQPVAAAPAAVLSGEEKQAAAAPASSESPVLSGGEKQAEAAPASSQSPRRLLEAQQADPTCRAIADLLSAGRVVSTTDNQVVKLAQAKAHLFELLNGVLYFRSPFGPRMFCPPSLQDEVFRGLHDSAFGAHMGVAKTLARIRSQYWWPGMEAYVKFRVDSCQVCCERKRSHSRAQWGLLKPVEVADIFHTVAADFLGPLPKTKSGNRYILVFMEYLTRFAIVIPSASADANTVATAFVDKVIPRFGAVCRFLSDRGQAFASNLVKAISTVFGTRKIFTSAYHPQCDGLVERFNSTLLNMLSKFTSANQDDWDEFTSAVEFAYNSSYQASVGDSPFFLLTGRDPLFPINFGELPADVLNSTAKITDVVEWREKLVSRLELARKLASDSLKASQKSAEAQYNRTHQPHRFLSGQMVWLYTPHVKKGLSPKLARPWSGPFRIVEVDQCTARLRSTKSSGSRALKQRIHVSRLKMYLGPLDAPPASSIGVQLAEQDDFDAALEDATDLT